MSIAVIGTYPPQWVGIGMYSSKIVEAMGKAGHEVMVFSFKGNEADGIEGCVRKNNPLSYILTALKIHKFKPDKVLIQYEYVHYNIIFFPILLCCLRMMGYKTNLMMHTIAPYDSGLKALVFRLIHLSIFTFTSSIFLHTTVAKDKLLKRTWIKRHVNIVPMAITKHKAAHKTKEAGKKLVCFGFISYDKGIDILCRAMEGVDAKLTIAGSVSPYAMKKQHDYLEEIKNLCKGKENIRLVDRYISNEEKEELFGEADFFVLPYRFIEQSAVLTEVWGYGKIPICSDVEAFREIVGDKHGVLFKAGDEEDLREKIKGIIKDKGRQEELLGNITKLINERSFEKVSQKLAGIMK